MGSATSSGPNQDPPTRRSDERRQMLLQRKVTVDILEKLARKLPTVVNPLGKTLRLNKDARSDLEWKENLTYLEEWKKSRRDEATIGNLIEVLKKSGHTADEYECLFNISRDPCNASTATEKILASHDQTNTFLSPHSAFISTPKCCQISNLSSFNPMADPSVLPQDYSFVTPLVQQHMRVKQNEELTGQTLRNNLLPTTLYDPPGGGCLFDNSNRDYKPPHKWTDFRCFGEIKSISPFINKSSSDPRIGNYVPGIACTSEAVIVSDAAKRCVHLFSRSGKIIQSLSTREHTPGGICQTREENLAVCCGRVVALWDRDGRVNGHFGDGFFTWCRGICSDSSNRLIVADTGKRVVSIHDSGGGLITTLKLPPENTFVKPYHVNVNYKDDILVSDTSQRCIYSFDKSGNFLRTLTKSKSERTLDMPMGLISDCAGNVMSSNYGNRSIDLFNSDGWFLKEVISIRYLSHRPVTMGLMGRGKLLVSMMKEDPLQLIEFS